MNSDELAPLAVRRERERIARKRIREVQCVVIAALVLLACSVEFRVLYCCSVFCILELCFSFLPYHVLFLDGKRMQDFNRCIAVTRSKARGQRRVSVSCTHIP